jgi:hypothetical protein
MAMSCCCCYHNMACYRYILYNKASCPSLAPYVRQGEHRTSCLSPVVSLLHSSRRIPIKWYCACHLSPHEAFFRPGLTASVLNPSWTENPAQGQAYPDPLHPSSFRPRSIPPFLPFPLNDIPQIPQIYLHLIPLDFKPTYLPSSLHYPHQPQPYTLFL